jgi:hypothetical protein
MRAKKNNLRPQSQHKGSNRASIPHKMITNLINYKKQPATLNTCKNSKLCIFSSTQGSEKQSIRKITEIAFIKQVQRDALLCNNC